MTEEERLKLKEAYVDLEPDDNYQSFRPDIYLKKFFIEISKPRLVAILNYFLKTEYPLDTSVVFEQTEHFSVLGDLGKNSVRGDLAASVGEDKIVVEFQSTRDNEMGFRMFVYGLNRAKKTDDQKQMKFPKAITLYTTLDLPMTGWDEVEFQLDHYSVAEKEYGRETPLVVKFPFVNLLAIPLEEYDQSAIEPLQAIHLYSYRKNEKLLENIEELEQILKNVKRIAHQETGEDERIITGFTAGLILDVKKVCKKVDKKEGTNYMDILEMTCKYTFNEIYEIVTEVVKEQIIKEEKQKLKEEIIKEQKQKLKEEIIKEQKQKLEEEKKQLESRAKEEKKQLESRAKEEKKQLESRAKEEKKKSMKFLFKIADNETIALEMDMTLEEVQRFRAELEEDGLL